jgi:MFS family permease
MTLFSVAFTMIPGPLIGGLLIEHYGVRAMIEGRDGIIPTPEIFLFSAFLMILPLIPVLMAKEKKA